MASGGGGEDGDFGFQIAPMVDVVFVLMLFFMASAGQQVVVRDLKIALPSGSTTKTDVIKTPIIVDIYADGSIFVNNQSFSSSKTDRELAQLREMLKTNVEASPDDPVIIRPQADTRHERIVDVLNACSAAHVKNLSFS